MNMNWNIKEARIKDIFLLCLFSFFPQESKMVKKEAETYLYQVPASNIAKDS